MKLSVIVVNWNTKDLLRQTLESLFSETKTLEFETIVVDNASTDGSVEMIKSEFPQVILIKNSQNVGFGRANNQAMQIAKGEYFFLLNSDTIVLSDAVNKLASALDKNSNVVMVGPKLLYGDKTLQDACKKRLPNISNSFLYLFGIKKSAYKFDASEYEHDSFAEQISGSAMMFRRSVFEEIGGFDEQFFLFCEDTDFCKRIQDRGWKILYLSNAEIIHLKGKTMEKRPFKSRIYFYKTMWLYYKKHFGVQHNILVRSFVYLGIKARLALDLLGF